MKVITLTVGELEAILKNPESVSEENRLALFLKGVQTELIERRIGSTVEEMQEVIRELRDELDETRGY